MKARIISIAAVVVGGALLLVGVLTMTGSDDDPGDDVATPTTGAEVPVDPADGATGDEGGEGGDAAVGSGTVDDPAVDDTGATEPPAASGASGSSDAATGPTTGGPTTTAPATETSPIGGDIVVSAPQQPEGDRTDEGESTTPVMSEGGALACANAEFAVDAWDADDAGQFQFHIGEAAALAATATEPAITAAAPSLTAAGSAADPATDLTTFLAACVTAGYGL